MIKFLRITEDTPNCKTEYEYAYCWNDKYTCIDATFVNLKVSPEVAINNIKRYIYCLMALNPDAGEYTLRGEALKMVKAHRRVYGNTPVLEEDVYNAAAHCMSNVPSDFRELCYTTKKIEWKMNIGGLVAMSDTEAKSIENIKDPHKRELKRKELVKAKKHGYAMKCIRKNNKMHTLELIHSAVLTLMDDPEEVDNITAGKISRLTGFTPKTVKKHIEEAVGSLIKVDLVKLDNRMTKFDVDAKLVNTCYNIHDNSEFITKMKLHKESGVSRPTIDSRWDDGVVNISEVVEQLNSKL